MSKTHKGCTTPQDWVPKQGEYPVMGEESSWHKKVMEPRNNQCNRISCMAAMQNSLTRFVTLIGTMQNMQAIFFKTRWLKEIDKTGESHDLL